MRKLIALSLAAVFTASAMGMAAIADDEKITVLVNGEEVVFEDTEPFIENERTLVPMRAIFEALGAVVEWDGEMRTVTSYDPVSDVSIVLQIGQATMFVNSEQIELDQPAKIVNDRTVVPVRAIAEGMNSSVDWDGETRTVVITKDLEKNGIADPWQEFATLDELNAAIGTSGAARTYSVSNPQMLVLDVEENGYRYLTSENMAEIRAIYSVGAGAEVVIRTMPGDTDISGIYGGEKVEEYLLSDSLVEIYKLEDTVYAIWSCEDAGTVFSHSVSATSPDFDATEILKQIVEDVETHHPVG